MTMLPVELDRAAWCLCPLDLSSKNDEDNDDENDENDAEDEDVNESEHVNENSNGDEPSVDDEFEPQDVTELISTSYCEDDGD